MNSFIRTLKHEGKIALREPSKVICYSYLEKSQESLRSARALIKIKSYNDAVALTYYSMYHSATALLYLCGIKSENHAGTIILLKELFGIDNDSISQAKKERVDKQYYVDFHANEKDVVAGIASAEQFNSVVKNRIDRIKNSEIKGIHEKARVLLR